MKVTEVPDEKLKEIFETLRTRHHDKQIRAWMIKGEIFNTLSVELSDSTIRGRFVDMNMPLNKQQSLDDFNADKVKREAEAKRKEEEEKANKAHDYNAFKEDAVPDELKKFIPKKEEFDEYVERETDKLIAVAYDRGKHPLTQGKQGTGKTYAHAFYAYKKNLPFLLFSCHEDMKLNKLFGDKTIVNGSIQFQESILVEACKSPSVILFDEINAVSQKCTFDWHALLQNRELYVKDVGKVYKLHDECRIGFSQNPKSSKYIGGNVLPSNFLGRCTFVTFPEFKAVELRKAMRKKFPNIDAKDIAKFVMYYRKLNNLINRNNLPIDISIRQLINTLDMYEGGLELKQALDIGIIHMLDAVSQPTAKEAVFSLAQGVWTELLPPDKANQQPDKEDDPNG